MSAVFGQQIDLVEIATQAIEAAAGIGALIQGLKLVELSRKYYDLYNAQRHFYYNVFQNGVETPLLADVYAKPIYVIDYAGRAATAYNALTGPFGGKATDTLGWWTRHANMYAFAPDPLITEMPIDLAALQSDWTNYLFRFEELWADIRNDERWARRLAIHNIGIKQGAEISTALDSALGQYQDNIQDMSNQLATYGNGVAKYAGYKRSLSDMREEFSHGTSYQRNISPANNTPSVDTIGGGYSPPTTPQSPFIGSPVRNNLVGIQ
jgi:hypothetical protein